MPKSTHRIDDVVMNLMRRQQQVDGADSHATFANSKRLPDGDWEIDIEQSTLDALQSQQIQGETLNDTLRRLLSQIPPGQFAREMAAKKRKPAPTVLDAFYKSSFRDDAGGGWTDSSKWRRAFMAARRFVLDDDMSTFLGELATQAFTKKDMSRPAAARMADHLRIGARLPFETTWVEYNLRNAMKRSHELTGSTFDPDQAPAREGWLLQQHPSLPTAIRAHILSHDEGRPDMQGFTAWTFPVAYAWTVDEDTVLPWRSVPFDTERGARPSEAATGIGGYITDRAGVVFSDMVNTPNDAAVISNLLSEWAGCLRRIWAFLATIDDLPTLMTEVRPSKGFIARGNYRKFLHHTTVTLTVPQKKYRKVIRQALALARRRAHSVRGHWRKDWRRPLSPTCEHDFTADERHMMCQLCKGRKIWVDPHQRGDVLQGLTTHDYNVIHESTPHENLPNDKKPSSP